MTAAGNDELTRLLTAARGGDEAAGDALLDLVYDELRQLARRHLDLERSGHTLQPTALVHEAYLRLAADPDGHWENRAHFFAACATAIRRILVEHARSRGRLKRGGPWRRVPLSESAVAVEEPSLDLIALDDALRKLAEIDPPHARVVELRFFGGMSVEETATFLGLSVPTVVRYWRLAKAWLYHELEGSSS